MPSAFICWSSRRISGFSTAVPNHHQRIMGFAEAGGFWKFCFRFISEACANKRVDVSVTIMVAIRRHGANAWLERGEERGKRGMVTPVYCWLLVVWLAMGIVARRRSHVSSFERMFQGENFSRIKSQSIA